jgi:hypothetical protein
VHLQVPGGVDELCIPALVYLDEMEDVVAEINTMFDLYVLTV